MRAIQQLINVIDAGNINVPEDSQLLRALRQATSDSVCIESRASLDLPFEQLCLRVSTCSGGCTAVTVVASCTSEVTEPDVTEPKAAETVNQAKVNEKTVQKDYTHTPRQRKNP